MKILLVNPVVQEVYGGLPASIQMPLGLAYVAAVLRMAGHEIQVIDLESRRLHDGTFREIVTDFRPSVVGATCTTPTYKSVVEICLSVKRISPDIKTVIGGIHPTIMPEDAVRDPVVDFCVVGEGEETAIDLVEVLKRNGDLSSVKGIAYKAEGRVVVNKRRELIHSLDKLPFPARDLFGNQEYTYPDSLYKDAVPIITSRGCPGRCTFCNTGSIFGGRFRARGARNVVDEIEFLVKKHGTREIHIWDDNFTTDKRRVLDIRDELRVRNLRVKFAFPNGIRADMLNEEILKVLKDMGAYSLAIGVESGSQLILDRARKGIKLERIEAVFKEARALRFETWAFFMLGLPGETKQTVRETIDFAKKIDPDIAKFHVLKPFPDTEVYQELKKARFLVTEDWSAYGIHTSPVHRLEGISPEEIMAFQKTAYRQFYLRPRKILQQVLRLRSVNRIKLNVRMGWAFFKKMIRR